MVQEMDPEAVDEYVPIEAGAEKLPLAFDNCVVKTFPELNVPVAVYETVNVPLGQIGF